MYCAKCGTLLVSGNRFCTNCGSPIPQLGTSVPSGEYVSVVSQSDENNKKANILCIVSLVLYFLGPIVFNIILSAINFILEDISFFALLIPSISPRLIAFILMIVARIKYPDSKFAKALMWIYVILL